MVDRLLQPTGLTIDYLCVVEPQEKIWGIESADSLEMDLNGIPDDRHYGPTRIVRPFHSRELDGREVVNDRQLIVAQASDMVTTASNLGLPVEEIEQRSGMGIAHFMAEQLAINILVESPRDGELSATAIPGLVLVLGNDPGTSPVMKLSEYSRPCTKPLVKLLASLATLGIERPDGSMKQLLELFKRAARTERGWLGSIFAAGVVGVGDTVSAYASLLPREPRTPHVGCID